MNKRVCKKILDWEENLGTIDCDVEYMIGIIRNEYSEENNSYKLGRISVLLEILEKKIDRLHLDVYHIINKYPEIITKGEN